MEPWIYCQQRLKALGNAVAQHYDPLPPPAPSGFSALSHHTISSRTISLSAYCAAATAKLLSSLDEFAQSVSQMIFENDF
jgi:hypothetical protein